MTAKYNTPLHYQIIKGPGQEVLITSLMTRTNHSQDNVKSHTSKHNLSTSGYDQILIVNGSHTPELSFQVTMI